MLSFGAPKPGQVGHHCTCLVSCEACLPLIHVVLTVVLTVAYNLNNGLKKSLNFYPLKPPAFVPLVQAVEFVAMGSTPCRAPAWILRGLHGCSCSVAGRSTGLSPCCCQ